MAKLAVIKTGGKQYIVKPGQKLKIEKLKDTKEGDAVSFDQVLLTADESGLDLKIGKPVVSGASVSAKILKEGKSKKVLVLRYKAKVRYKKKKGHRQPFTEVMIEDIK
ncbi:TPA: 50S ribosomal protein L21 [Patescibacteria group bacterium]|nr:MAG: 50S ribosomal protein L21 [Parcubacteria group bacterium GW2011_GWF2_40_10]KKR47626.1 MAG: 50S ribosomal protein L21 [Parcubacteria group bacterium GW2011_GWA2_40_143]KKR59991.1 MAG: 50S ribosomal protein L21 [Parcubacteria group bacterium GW2011_GWC2_40_31]KKR75525.1 MAG: 50S ribosomal protein L21 [Parcubacteria group bacterium GW2011_GWB2_40_8]KKR82712.1 MAG: 50S ribosomal protein L21 [Parcubacteria group bacterium GW2011_GWD2_40_9]HBB56840.1 50S ribosomal protein L21 [Patescibacteri